MVWYAMMEMSDRLLLWCGEVVAEASKDVHGMVSSIGGFGGRSWC